MESERFSDLLYSPLVHHVSGLWSPRRPADLDPDEMMETPAADVGAQASWDGWPCRGGRRGRAGTAAMPPKTWSDGSTTGPLTFRSRIHHRLDLPVPHVASSQTASISTTGDPPSNSFGCYTLDTNLSTPYPVSERMSLQFWSRPVSTQPIVLNEQAIVDNLTEDNVTMMWPNRRKWEEEQLYLVHDQGTASPYSLVVKKFQNVNPAIQVIDNVKYRYNSEMILLASNSHDNIIKVIDLIQREDAIMLVYEYPVNGSLQSRLHQPMDAGQPLSWPERRTIAIGTAQGLCHLHDGCNKPIVHHNISSSNILLGQNFKPVIVSFGDAQVNMAGLGQPLPITDLPPGNFGYTAPEYAASQLTEKVDLYSFGVLLLELVTGWVVIRPGVDGLLAIWARDNCNELMANHLKIFKISVDKGISDQPRYMEEMAAVFRLGVDCTVRDPLQRPSMQMALKRLRRGLGRC